MENLLPSVCVVDESINRDVVCAHKHFIIQTQKMLTCARRMHADNKNTPSMHHPRRRNVTTSLAGLKKTVTYAKISPKMVNPRDIAGERRRRRRSPNRSIPEFCTSSCWDVEHPGNKPTFFFYVPQPDFWGSPF